MKTNIERQLELELEGINQGIEKFRQEMTKAKQSQAYGDTGVGSIVIHKMMTPLTQGLISFVKSGGSTNRERDIITFLARLNPAKVSLITLKVLVSNTAHRKITMVSLCQSVASAIETEINIEAFGKSLNADGTNRSKYVADIVKAKSKQGSSKQRTAKVFAGMMEKHSFIPIMTDKQELFIIGQKVLDIFMQAMPGFLEIGYGNKRHGVKSERTVELTKAFVDILVKLEKECEVLNPILYPMLVPPIPHAKGELGGFLSEPLRIPLVKDIRNKPKKYLLKYDMPHVYDAINHIQNTAWKINKDVLDVLAELLIRGVAIPQLDLPSGNEVEIPPKPWGVLSNAEWEAYRSDDRNKETMRAWKDKARVAYNQNISERSKRILYRSLVSVASKLKDEPELYYVYDLDWRGRVYPVQSGGCPNPQGLDASKALLTFAKGEPLGEFGEYWLSVAGANSFGYDKIPMDERGAWARVNGQDILRVAEDPLTNKWWWEADEPWKFLAFCFEWAKYAKSGYSKEFISYLPVPLDGSCSGIQHFSALLLDERGAKATNVISNGTKTPSDIYNEVAKEVAIKVEQDAKDGILEAILLKGKINRSLTKRNTMTTPYGVSQRGMVDQLLRELDREEFSSVTVSFYNVCRYLAHANQEAISKVVVASKVAMDWLKSVTDVMAEANKVFSWYTPSGFRVEQRYMKSQTKRIETFWGSTRVKLSLSSETPFIDHVKVKQGQAPNYIHSMDAAHLMLTVNSCTTKGIDSFALIHDSFGTHAGKTAELARILREEFVKMYSKDNLAEFRREIINQLPDELKHKVPSVPQRGSLDIHAVMDSIYFFS